MAFYLKKVLENQKLSMIINNMCLNFVLFPPIMILFDY